MKTLSADQKKNGNGIQLSEQAVAVPSIVPDWSSPETAKCLLALVMGMMREMPCGDAFYLACMHGEGIAEKAGCNGEDYLRVVKIAEQHYKLQRKFNPLSGMF